jgi:hypothetical protein
MTKLSKYCRCGFVHFNRDSPVKKLSGDITKHGTYHKRIKKLLGGVAFVDAPKVMYLAYHHFDISVCKEYATDAKRLMAETGKKIHFPTDKDRKWAMATVVTKISERVSNPNMKFDRLNFIRCNDGISQAITDRYLVMPMWSYKQAHQKLSSIQRNIEARSPEYCEWVMDDSRASFSPTRRDSKEHTDVIKDTISKLEFDSKCKKQARKDLDRLADVMANISKEDDRIFIERRLKKNYDKLSELQEQNVVLLKERDEIKEKLNLLTADTTVVAGMTPSKLLSREWHQHHTTACSHLFGFKNFDEFIMYHSIFFPGISTHMKKPAVGGTSDDTVSEIEKSVMYLLRVECKLSLAFISFIWPIHRTTIGRYIKKWAIKWGRLGQHLSFLDVNRTYLEEETNAVWDKVNMSKVAVLDDGKDYSMEVVRKDSAVKSSMYSDKIGGSAVRNITWSTKSGLVNHYSWLFNGRASEGTIVEHMGEHRGTIPTQKADTALMDKHHCCTCIPHPWPKGINHRIRVKGNQKGTKRKRSVEKHDDNSDSDGDSDIDGDCDEQEPDNYGDEFDADHIDTSSKLPQKTINLAVMTENFYRKKRVDRKVNVEDSVEGLKGLREKLLNSGPNESSERKLEQLMLHRRLDEAYQAKQLQPCLIAYYVRKMATIRDVVIKRLLGEDVTQEEIAITTNMPTGLQQIPIGMAVLADRGFGYDCLKYPNVNVHLTPTYIDSVKGQFNHEENNADLITCRLRYSCETVFARVTNVALLQSTVEHGLFPILQHVHFWAHGRANLQQPFQKPADYDITVGNFM